MKNKIILIIVCCLILPSISYSSTYAELRRYHWSKVKNWVYQLQSYTNDSLNEIGSTGFDLAVIDYSADGAAATEWTPAEIAALKDSPGGPKKVVAYLSIGEAENYRYYWQPWWVPGNPDWIVEPNPDWPGAFRVKYWVTDWQNIVYGASSSYLDKILAQGFDGIYLDTITSYQKAYAAGHEQDMVDFVINIANYARAHSTVGNDLAVFPQNAEELRVHSEYLAAVNGIGKEETYFIATDVPTSDTDRTYTEENLDYFKTAGLWAFGLVLEIDYADVQANIDFVYQRCGQKNYIPYATVLALDVCRINPGHAPGYPPPMHVKNLRLVKQSSNISLTWQAVTQDTAGNSVIIDHYNIYRGSQPSYNPSSFAFAGNSTSTTWIDTSASSPKLYYLVSAVSNQNEESVY